eukprot:TRINITY_DN59974_c0_g1_i1.p1 TRINITY_DN59974_c0_g1~~TRINITY_DN59974_c0_g1_i1.p1  ORF type:complete len:180 (-),score=25.11 TRINITY_DN59974_c0_g1_i1:420-959(-)
MGPHAETSGAKVFALLVLCAWARSLHRGSFCSPAAAAADRSSVGPAAPSTVAPDVQQAFRDKLEAAFATTSGEDEELCCARCNSPVAKMKFNEGDARQMNPAGYLFHLGLFSRADGAVGTGAAYSKDCWYPGYLWRIAVCRNCEQHLGWHFLSRTSRTSFWGLIWNRLARTSSSPSDDP